MDLNKACIIDIETNGLLADMLNYKEFPYRLKSDAKLWCVSIRNVATSEVKSAVRGEITREWLEETLSEYDYIIAHNGIKFDLPTLKLFGLLDYRIGYLGQSDTMYGRDVVFIDTLILSRLFSPDRYNGHSLESWGIRVGSEKTDFRGLCIEKGYIDAKAPKGAEFRSFCPEMVEYCEQDTLTNLHTFNLLVEEMSGYKGWARPIVVEKKLADQAVCRENLGFFFDKPAAVALLKDLTEKMEAIERTILPILPPKKMGKTEIKNYILPKKQFTKDGSLTKGVITKVEKMGGVLTQDGANHNVLMGDKLFTLPYHEPLQTHVEASMKDLDHIKMYLISLGWVPTEWRERDITKDTKKQKLSIEKRREVLNRWYQETMDGKYKEARLDHLNMSEHGLYEFFEEKLHSEWPVRVPTSPSVRVGVEKELCPNLTALGDKVAFAKDFALYLTYKHRKSSIAGGEIEDMDFDIEYPNTGFLSMYREEDQRVPTPAIEIGTNTFRYRHVGISNIARATSIYGKEMRSLFGSGKNGLQFGYDFSSLEARIQGHYCWKYPGGEELAATLLAEKPNDIHCYSEDTEILTIDGWKTFGEISLDTFVAQYSEETKSLQWVYPTEIVWQDYEGPMVSISNKNTDQLLTPNHRVYTVSGKYRRGNIDLAENLLEGGFNERRFLNGGVLQGGIEIPDHILKLVIATQADGCLAKDCSAITFSFTKQKKIDYLLSILEDSSTPYTVQTHNRKGRVETKIRLNASSVTRTIRVWLTDDKELEYSLLYLNLEQRRTIIEEISKWDGTVGKSGIILDITCEQTISVLQSICSTSGYKSTITRFTKNTSYGVCNVIRLFISLNVDCISGIRGTMRKLVPYKGKIGCVAVPSTLILVRRNGKVFISGNTLTGLRLGIPRSDAKSINYAILYGSSWNKIMKMLVCSPERAKEIVEGFWDSMPALKALKANVEAHWEANDKKFVVGIDGRKINIRSKHSILNALFQSAGVISAKYVNVLSMQKLEELGYCISPFEGVPDVCEMIAYHDECQLFCGKSLFNFPMFETEDEAKAFVADFDSTEGQLSAISEGKKWYVCQPNVVSKSIEEAIEDTERILKLNVELGYEWIVNTTWYGCH